MHVKVMALGLGLMLVAAELITPSGLTEDVNDIRRTWGLLHSDVLKVSQLGMFAIFM